MFSDSLEINSKLGEPMLISKDSIAWDDDLNYKFQNPKGLDKDTYDKKLTKESVAFNKHFVKPIDWDQNMWEKFWKNGGVKNHDFVTWMSPSPFPTLRKFYGEIKSVHSCKNPRSLCEGDYDLRIDYRKSVNLLFILSFVGTFIRICFTHTILEFPVDPHKGQKSLVLATTSFLGTPNPFIGWFTLGFGAFLCFLSVLFVTVHKLYRKIKYDSYFNNVIIPFV